MSDRTAPPSRFQLLLAPVVCSAAPVIMGALFYSGTNPLSLWQIVRACLLVMGVTGAVLLLLARSPARLEQFGAAAAIFALCSCFFPPAMVAWGIPAFSVADRLVGIPLLTVLGLLVGFAVRVDAATVRQTSSVLTVVALVLLLSSGFTLGRREWQRATEARLYQVAPEQPLPVLSGKRPDIVHIVFDSLGRPDQLQTTYGLDTSAFELSWEQAGLVVEPTAFSNYAQTYLSLASMLSLDYLDSERLTALEFGHREALKTILENAVAIRALKQSGYRFELLSSGYSAVDRHPLSDGGISGPLLFGDFEGYAVLWHPVRLWPYWGWTHAPHEQRTRAILERLKSHRRVPGRPTYVLAHLLVPHPPFVFGEDGTIRRPNRPFGLRDGSQFPDADDIYIEGYRAQAAFVLRQLEAIVANLQRDHPDVVLMVNGDHGPGLGFSFEQPEYSVAEDRMAIFMAVWPPDSFAPPPSPVNLYRRLFSRLSRQPIPDLPDRAFLSGWARPFDFIEVDPDAPLQLRPR